MRRLVPVAALTLGLLGLAVPQSPAGVVCDRTIVIDTFAFSPSLAANGVRDDLVVCWRNDDGTTHTATSNTGMFDTGPVMPGMTDNASLFGSGSYAYHCSIHAGMTGRFNVRPAVSDTSITVGRTVTLTVGDQGVLTGVSWDVQKRRNDGPWITIRTGTTDPSFGVKPGLTGTLRYRARTHVLENVSGWSPARAVKVSAA